MNSTGELREKVYSVHKLRKYVRIGQYSQKSMLPLNSWDETESVLYGSDFFSGDSSGRRLYRVRYMLDAPFKRYKESQWIKTIIKKFTNGTILVNLIFG